jgi:hypothetical protein
VLVHVERRQVPQHVQHDRIWREPKSSGYLNLRTQCTSDEGQADLWIRHALVFMLVVWILYGVVIVDIAWGG